MPVVKDNSARGQWPIGHIVELCPDRRGLVRNAMVKMQGGCIHRHISKLCPIVTGVDKYFFGLDRKLALMFDK